MTHQTRIRIGMALATAVCVAVTACGSVHGEGDDGPDSSGPSGQPQAGGTIRMILPSDGEDLDPAHTTVAPLTGIGDLILPIFDTLVRVDAQGTITPRIATDVTTSDQGTTWTIALRDGVKFSDGTPYDAEALRFNWERYGQAESTQTTDAKQIAGMRVIDPRKLEVTLAAPNASFPYLLQGALGMNGSPTAIREMGEDYSVAPVGAGPFTLEERNPGSSYRYSRNPDYWDSPRPYADGLETRIIRDTRRMAESFRAGEAEMIHGSYDDVVWQELEEGGFRVMTPEVFGGLAFWFNNSVAPLDDARVRRALVMAMNPDDANEKVEEGAATPAYNLFPEDSPYFVPEATLPFKGDLTEAQSLIDEYVGENGGNPLTITWSTNEGASSRWVQAYAQQINRLENVEVRIETLTVPALLGNLYDDTFEIAAGSLVGVDPALQLAQRFSCESGRNNANYCNPDFDAAVADALETDDLAARVDAITRAQEILLRDLPFFLQSRQVMYTAVSDDVGGMDTFAEGLLTLDSAWLQQ